jgi:hypothetical protein
LAAAVLFDADGIILRGERMPVKIYWPKYIFMANEFEGKVGCFKAYSGKYSSSQWLSDSLALKSMLRSGPHTSRSSQTAVAPADI